MTIRPINYSLTFEPDLEKFSFKGEEVLTFEIKQKIKEITLDAADLRIVRCYLLGVKGNKVETFRVNKKEEKLIISLNQALKRGKYKLNIEFEGVLNDKLAGFYRSRYLIDGKERYMATTQFEAADARRAFPCIDHPVYKATFDISLVIDTKLIAISNTLPVIRPQKSTASVGKRVVKFEQTPLMSTYLLYLGVGEFEFLEDKYRDFLLRIITTPGKSKYGAFALECAKKSLEFFEGFFGFPYPLKKLDLIAVPEFASGAMENWGAITFRENALLFYPEKSSQATKQRIAEIIAHEVAHQWFGNLVTMKWWDDLWLNESFATYLANKVLDRYWFDWHVWDQYVTDTVFEGMGLDALKSSHPIQVKVEKISEIDELFDEIAYEKGGSILRMLNIYLGESIFKTGLRKYIRKYAYKNADANDLWGTLEKNSEKPVVGLMKSYIQQVGFPELKIEKIKNKLKIKQSKFLYESDNHSKQKWIIPHKPDNDFYLNKNYSGFYISNYSEELLENIGRNIFKLNNQEKIGIIHDLFALIMAGKKDLQSLYEFTENYLIREESELVLHYLISKLSGIYLLLKDAGSKKISEELANNVLKKITGFEPEKGENILKAYLRTSSLSTLTLFDDSRIRKFIQRKFMDYMKKESTLHPDLRGIIFSGAVWFDDSNYQIIKNLYNSSDSQEEKAKFLIALSNSKNSKLIKDALEFSLGDTVPFSFIIYIISPISRNPYAKKIVLDWLFENWESVRNRSGGLANMLLRRILQSIIPICGIGREKEIMDFLKVNKMPGLERSTEQALERLRINMLFVRKYKAY